MIGESLRIIPLQRHDVPQVMTVEQELPGGWTEPQLLAELASGIGWQYGVRSFQGGPLLGYVFGRSVLDEAEIFRLAVINSSRRKGIATFMLTSLAEILDARGVNSCHLEVRAANRAALRLYEKIGFVVTGFRKAYYKDPLDDAVTMTVRWT